MTNEPPFTCHRCGRPIEQHGIYHDEPPHVTGPEGLFDFPTSGLYCPPEVADSAIVPCEDPDCPEAWAHQDPPREHYHPRPHGPELPRTDDRDPTSTSGHARTTTEHEVASPPTPGLPTGPTEQAHVQGEPAASPGPPEWCECGHSTQMHDLIVGCLINECPCTPAETIERLTRDR